MVTKLARWARGDAGRRRSQDREDVTHSRKVSAVTEMAGRHRAELGQYGHGATCTLASLGGRGATELRLSEVLPPFHNLNLVVKHV